MKKLLLAVLLSISVSGCATVFTGTSDRIAFSSDPDGANILVNGVNKGQTPSTIVVKRKLSDTYVTLEKTGFVDRTILLENQFNSASIFNTLNMAGWVIDGVSGSVMEYSMKSYNVELEKNFTSKLGAIKDNINLDPYVNQDHNIISIPKKQVQKFSLDPELDSFLDFENTELDSSPVTSTGGAVFGSIVGYLSGGVIVAKLSNCENDEEYFSCLNEVLIGSAIGAVVGGVVGYNIILRRDAVEMSYKFKFN